MLKVKKKRWIGVSFCDLDTVLSHLRSKKCKITKIRSFRLLSLRINLVWHTEYVVPSLNVVCRHIEQATIANQNLSRVYDLMSTHSDLYSWSHCGLIGDLFSNKEKELVQNVIKLHKHF